MNKKVTDWQIERADGAEQNILDGHGSDLAVLNEPQDVLKAVVVEEDSL